MANVNKVILIGHLTRDPQTSYTPTQVAIVDFGLAINRTWKDSGGEERKEVCFVDCQAFSKNAENLKKYTHKGDQLYIDGRLKFESWDAKDGTKRSKIRIHVERFQFLTAHQAKQDPAAAQTDPADPNDY